MNNYSQHFASLSEICEKEYGTETTRWLRSVFFYAQENCDKLYHLNEKGELISMIKQLEEQQEAGGRGAEGLEYFARMIYGRKYGNTHYRIPIEKQCKITGVVKDDFAGKTTELFLKGKCVYEQLHTKTLFELDIERINPAFFASGKIYRKTTALSDDPVSNRITSEREQRMMRDMEKASVFRLQQDYRYIRYLSETLKSHGLSLASVSWENIFEELQVDAFGNPLCPMEGKLPFLDDYYPEAVTAAEPTLAHTTYLLSFLIGSQDLTSFCRKQAEQIPLPIRFLSEKQPEERVSKGLFYYFLLRISAILLCWNYFISLLQENRDALLVMDDCDPSFYAHAKVLLSGKEIEELTEMEYFFFVEWMCRIAQRKADNNQQFHKAADFFLSSCYPFYTELDIAGMYFFGLSKAVMHRTEEHPNTGPILSESILAYCLYAMQRKEKHLQGIAGDMWITPALADIYIPYKEASLLNLNRKVNEKSIRSMDRMMKNLMFFINNTCSVIISDCRVVRTDDGAQKILLFGSMRRYNLEKLSVNQNALSVSTKHELHLYENASGELCAFSIGEQEENDFHGMREVSVCQRHTDPLYEQALTGVHTWFPPSGSLSYRQRYVSRGKNGTVLQLGAQAHADYPYFNPNPKLIQQKTRLACIVIRTEKNFRNEEFLILYAKGQTIAVPKRDASVLCNGRLDFKEALTLDELYQPGDTVYVKVNKIISKKVSNPKSEQECFTIYASISFAEMEHASKLKGRCRKDAEYRTQLFQKTHSGTLCAKAADGDGNRYYFIRPHLEGRMPFPIVRCKVEDGKNPVLGSSVSFRFCPDTVLQKLSYSEVVVGMMAEE